MFKTDQPNFNNLNHKIFTYKNTRKRRKDDFNWREFITSIAIGSLLPMSLNPISSFGNIIKMLLT